LLTGRISLDALIGPGFEALVLFALAGMELLAVPMVALSGDLSSSFSYLVFDVILLFSGNVGLCGSSLVLSVDFYFLIIGGNN
jgi:hypothetical protein